MIEVNININENITMQASEGNYLLSVSMVPKRHGRLCFDWPKIKFPNDFYEVQGLHADYKKVPTFLSRLFQRLIITVFPAIAHTIAICFQCSRPHARLWKRSLSKHYQVKILAGSLSSNSAKLSWRDSDGVVYDDEQIIQIEREQHHESLEK